MTTAISESAPSHEPERPSAVERLRARLPPELAPLAELAYDLWWTWQPEARALFQAIDPDASRAALGDPLEILLETAPEHLDQLARDPAFTEKMRAVSAARARELSRPEVEAPPASLRHPVAFFCAEFAIHRSLPIYAGGLGVLAGDILKEASDRALPMIGVGLFYHQGSFHQRLDPTGLQHEYWLSARPTHAPLELARTPDGSVAQIELMVEGRRVVVQAWRANIGRVPLVLLDTNLPQNTPVDRFITAQLYIGDPQLRLRQYLVLGVGGVRVLRALGVDPAVVHLNEGHPAFAALELVREQLIGGHSLAEAIANTRERTVFTTHTPVAAGNESYSEADVLGTLADVLSVPGIDPHALVALGHTSDESSHNFGMTQLALRMARSANAVSQMHGMVARKMWQPLFGGHSEETVPIKHVTNAVHLPTWMAPPMRELLSTYLGEGWEGRASDPWTFSAVAQIPDELLWSVRERLRAELVHYLRTQSVQDRLARGEALAYVELAARSFDPHVLTIGFARRVAAYKRLDLLTSDIGRALALLGSEHPIQVVIAGKAHPRDNDAKRIVQHIFQIKRSPPVGGRVVFLEDYDLDMAARLVAGCDVWLNLPRPPLEASGTSGMKAVLNGGLHLSVLDGWWHEAWDGTNGWAIDSQPGPDRAIQDARDADKLYDLLEHEVVPLFYRRDEQGIPRGWLAKVKASVSSLAPRFSAGRMLQDYLFRVYGSAPQGPP